MKKLLLSLLFVVCTLYLYSQALPVNLTREMILSDTRLNPNVINVTDNFIELFVQGKSQFYYFGNSEICNILLIEEKNKSKADITNELDSDPQMFGGPKYEVDYWIYAFITPEGEYRYQVKIVTKPDLSNSYFVEYKFHLVEKDAMFYYNKL